MPSFTRLFFTTLAICSCQVVFSQNILVTYQNPDALFVCGTDTLKVTVQNTATVQVGGLFVAVTFPDGVGYIPGAVAGATEADITNPGAPKFALNDLPAGAATTLSIPVRAGCDLLDAINSGSQFSNTISVNYDGGSQQWTTDFFTIETALLIIQDIAPSSQTGMAGDVLTRTIKVRNTRQGPIAALRFSDQHQPGIAINLTGAAGQNSAILFEADVPGSYFTAFGDGDPFFEYNEVVIFTEEVTVTDCGIPPNTIVSLVQIGWGCDGTICQSDSAEAAVAVLPSGNNPLLVFTPLYAPPLSYCGSEPAVQEFLVVNTGNTIAENLNVTMMSSDSFRLGMDIHSFQLNTGTGWAPLQATSGLTAPLASCNIDSFYKTTTINLPALAPGDSLRVRFDAYFCQFNCQSDNVGMKGIFTYSKVCPQGSVGSGAFELAPNEAELALDARVYYDIGVCLGNNTVHTFDYWVESKRLQTFDGYLRLKLKLPWGIFWESGCVPELDGQTPLLVAIDTVVNVETAVNLVFKLPMSVDSVAGKLCLRTVCQDVSAYEPAIGYLPPSGEDFSIYPSDSTCSACVQKVEALTYLTTTPDLDDECGVSVCDEFSLVLDCGCEEDTTGNFRITAFDSWRVNVGLRDNDDNRVADSYDPADSPFLRLDRFLPGDTMRTLTRGVVEGANLDEISFRIFNESWESDFGLDGGDAFGILTAKPGFTDADQLRFLDGSVTLIIASSGQQYTCPVGAASAISDQHYVEVAEPNVRPEDVTEQFVSMFHQFTIDIPLLATLGCVPTDLKLQPGDSVLFTGDYKFFLNFTPQGSGEPPLINFRNTACNTGSSLAWKSGRCLPPLRRQYSGYKERVIPPVYQLQGCENATELSPFRYSIRIARENLFPYELRRLSAITDFQHSLTPGVSLSGVQLKFLNMQETIPLFGNEAMSPEMAGDVFKLDFQPYFIQPIDEGFALESSFTFGPNCGFDGPKIATTKVTTGYFSDGFHNPNPFQAVIANPFAYLSGQPDLKLEVQDTILQIPDGALQLDFTLDNNAPNISPNTWFSWETTGDFSDVELLLMPQQTPLPVSGALFQLGDMEKFEVLVLRLKGRISSCDPVYLTLRYGWDCDPVSNPGANTCGVFEKKLLVQTADPELELVVIAQPAEVPMCAPSDNFEFEIYNAAEGVAFDVLASVKLPPGLGMVPGSSRLSYPAGNPFVSLPDPVSLPGNVFQWTPGSASAALATAGLQSIGDEPDNALRIRFRVQAVCGFVANTRPVYGAEALQPCGALSNILRKPGAPVQLEGFGPSYDVAASLVYADVQDGEDCGESSVLTASISLDGTTGPGDSIYVVLPAGVSYAAGSYQPGLNAPGGPPQVVGNVLQLPFPANLPGNATLQFNFTVVYGNAADCADQAVLLQTRERVAVFCPLLNQNCAVYIATGEALLFLKVKNPDLVLQNFETALNGNTLAFAANLLNEGSGAATEPLVQFYLDQNGNGQVDANEPLVASLSPGQSLAPGSALPIAGSFNLPPSVLCQLIAFIPGAANCACSDKVFPLNQNPVVTTVAGFCEVGTAPLGVDSIAGHTYTWITPDGLSCTDCAKTVFTPGPEIQAGDAVTLVLKEQTPDCSIEYRFELQFGGSTDWEAPDRFICRGETVKLEAPAGGSYQWSGPGLGNPAAAVQIVQPDQTAAYSVTITYAGGCTGTGQVNVTVFQTDNLDLGTLFTCPGNPVNVFGTLTEQPGMYTQNLQNTDGCDSISVLRLIVFPTETFEVRSLCPGDSVTVYDSVFMQAGKLCRSFTTGLGCDSTHCVTVEVLPEPDLPAVQDSFVIGAGEEVQLLAPEGFASYAWSPSAGLSCTDCFDPLAGPDTTTVYLLTVADPNGCQAAVTYRVLLCDFEKLAVPNAFTPNGDGVNDVFRVVPSENIAQIQSLTVFNRWGKKVWQGSGDQAAWDGTIDGKPAASDVYVWLLQGNCGGDIREKKGDVALLR